MAKQASGKKAFGFSDRSGFRYPLKDLIPQIINRRKSGLLVGKDELDEDHPQWRLGSVNTSEGISLHNPRPDKGLEDSRQVYLPRISVIGKNLMRSGLPFKVYGFQQINHVYDDGYYSSTDEQYRLDAVKWLTANQEMGANVQRLHLQLWTFVEGTSLNDLAVKPRAISNLLYQLDAARQLQMYVLMSGCNSWIVANTPAWFDELTYLDRWEVYEFFWSEVASAVVAAGHQTTILGYELVSEPATSTSPTSAWYLGELSIYFFAPVIARGPEVDGDTVRAWIIKLRDAIKAHDPQGLVTFGANNLNSLSSTFGVENTQDLLDFLSPHGYPPLSEGNVDAWTSGTTPVVWGEISLFVGESSSAKTMRLVSAAVEGVIAFSFGYPPEEFVYPTTFPAEYLEPDDLSGIIVYAVQGLALERFLTYRDAYLADQDLGLIP
jgi:hypothetical protein